MNKMRCWAACCRPLQRWSESSQTRRLAMQASCRGCKWRRPRRVNSPKTRAWWMTTSCMINSSWAAGVCSKNQTTWSTLSSSSSNSCKNSNSSSSNNLAFSIRSNCISSSCSILSSGLLLKTTNSNSSCQWERSCLRSSSLMTRQWI